MCTFFVMLLPPRCIIMPILLAAMDAQRLRSPVNLLHVSGSLCSIVVLITFRFALPRHVHQLIIRNICLLALCHRPQIWPAV